VTALVEQMNRVMRPYRVRAETLLESDRLHGELIDLIAEGLMVDDGCLYFAGEFRRSHGGAEQSRTGREAFVNHVHFGHLDDVERPGEEWAAEAVAQGILLARRVFDLARPLNLGLPIIASVSLQDDEYRVSTFRFYLDRREDPLLDRDLESYSEPVLTLKWAGV
jgi:hypothetical protein